MPSRMNKYYEETITSRSKKNEELYKSLYEETDYSNITSVATLEKTNEIDISKVKQLIKDRENYQRQKDYYDLIKKQKQNEPTKNSIEEEKSYDIRDVLNRAKEERKIDEKEEFLKSKHYDYLLNSQAYNKKREIELNEKEEKLNKILNTITTTLELNKLSNKDLSLDLLDDLKGNTKEITNTSVKKIIEEEKERSLKEENDNTQMDKSFYTSAMNFKKEDFDDDTIIENKKSKTWIKVLLIIIILLILAITIYVVIKNI